jgi:prepilin-type N-terminal cleavage/methylation domain-containing protein
MTTPSRGPAGFSLIEVIVTIVMIGLMTAFALPHLRRSELSKTRDAAELLARDLEALRSRALDARAQTRLVFMPDSSQYAAYLDDDRNGVIAQNAAEAAAVQVFRLRRLDAGIRFGRGGAPAVPGTSGAGAITFASGFLEFNSRGLTTPLGTSGVIYFASGTDSLAVSAVQVTGAASMRSWSYRGGAWQ